MTLRIFKMSCATLLAMLANSALAFAQTTNTGVITGIVLDQQGLFLPGATIELLNEGTGTIRPITTESNGAFTFSAVDPGAYTLKITMSGFRSVERRGIQLRSRETLKLGTLTLEVGQFARPAQGDEGNGGRAVIRLPGSNVTDLSFNKTLIGNRRRGLEFRIELYNAFNQVIWTTVNNSARFDTTGAQINAQFGQVTGAANPRIGQLGLRFVF